MQNIMLISILFGRTSEETIPLYFICVCLRGPNESHCLCFAYIKCSVRLFTRFRSNPFGIHTSLVNLIRYGSTFEQNQQPRIAIRIRISISLFMFSDCVDACKHFNGNVCQKKEWTLPHGYSHSEWHFLSQIETVLRSGVAYIWIAWRGLVVSVRPRSY